MNNLAKTLFAAATAAVIITSTIATTFAAEQVVSVVAIHSPLRFNRIWVNGNVTILLTQGEKTSIVGTENYDPSKTSVMSDGHTLYIKSKEYGQVVLSITVNDLQRVIAYGHARIVTTNNFDVKNLQVFLNQKSKAKIKTTTQSLYTVVKDDAVLKLKGTANESTLVARNLKNIKLGDFNTRRSKLYATEAIMKSEKTAMMLPK